VRDELEKSRSKINFDTTLAHRHSAKRRAAVADAIAKGKENMLLWHFVAGA
jgi:hypothetical protein